MKTINIITKSIGRLFLSIAKPIGKLFLSISKSIGRFLLSIAKPIGRLIIAIAKPIGLFLKKLFILIAKVFLAIVYFFKLVLIKVCRGIKFISLYIWNYSLKYIYLFFKKVGYYFYFVLKYVLIKLYLLIKPILKAIFRIISFILTKIYFIIDKFVRIFYYIFSKLFINIFKILEWLIKGISSLFSKIIKGIANFFKSLISFFRYGFRSLPDSIYRFLVSLVFFVYLVVHFILFEFVIWIAYSIPKFILLKLWQYVLFVFSKILNLIIRFFLIIGRLLRRSYAKMIYAFYFIIDLVYDLFSRFQLILISPIILPVFLLIFVIVFVKFIFVIFLFTIKALFNHSNYHVHDLIYIKPLYLPSLNLFKISSNYLGYLNNEYATASKLKNVWLLVNIFVWKLLFSYLIIGLFALLLLPLTILTSIYHYLVYHYEVKRDFNEFLMKRIKVVKDTSNGFVNLSKTTMYGRKITFKSKETFAYDDLVRNYLIDIDDSENIQINLLVDGARFKSYNFKVNLNIEWILYYHFYQIKSKLESINLMQFDLPKIENENITLTYEKIRSRDTLTNNNFKIRSNATKTNMRLYLEYKNSKYTIERDVSINSIINTVLISQLNLDSRIFKLYNQESLTNYLDKRLSYSFIENDYVSKEGIINAQDDKVVNVAFYITDIPDKIYNASVVACVKEKEFSYFMKQIKAPVFDLKEKKLNLISHLTNKDGSFREITWTINSEKVNRNPLFEKHYQYFGVKKFYNVEAVFLFNNRYVSKNFKMLNPTNTKENHFNYALSAMLRLDYINSEQKIEFSSPEHYLHYKKKSNNSYNNKKYIYLPMISPKYAQLVKWRSLEPNIITSSGKVLDPVYKSVLFEVTFYCNLFIKKTYQVRIDLRKI